MASAGGTGNGRKRRKTLPDWVAKSLECPVCLETIEDPPIYLCAKGHGLCNTCREKIKAQGKCPECRSKLTEARNIALEQMLENLPKIKCKYDGCNFQRVNDELVKIHEDEECKEKPVKCQLCPESLALSKLYSHLETKHNRISCDLILGKVERTFGCKLDHNNMTNIMKVNNDLEFILNRKHFDLNVTMFWISFLGSPIQAKQYKYTIKILSSADYKAGRKKYIVSGTGECLSCQVSHEDVKKTVEEALLFSRKKLEKEAEEDDEKKLWWAVMIEKK